MTSSFPYMTIAKKHGVPYAEVLEVVDFFERNKVKPPVMDDLVSEIYAAWTEETKRRQK